MIVGAWTAVVGGDVVDEVVAGEVAGGVVACGTGTGSTGEACVAGRVVGVVAAGPDAGAVGLGAGATSAGVAAGAGAGAGCAGAGAGAGAGVGCVGVATNAGRGELGEVARGVDSPVVASGAVGTVSFSGAVTAGAADVATGSSVGMASGETVRSTDSAWLAAAVGPAGAESRTIRLSTRPPATQAPIRIPDLQFTMFLVT